MTAKIPKDVEHLVMTDMCSFVVMNDLMAQHDHRVETEAALIALQIKAAAREEDYPTSEFRSRMFGLLRKWNCMCGLSRG